MSFSPCHHHCTDEKRETLILGEESEDDLRWDSMCHKLRDKQVPFVELQFVVGVVVTTVECSNNNVSDFLEFKLEWNRRAEFNFCWLWTISLKGLPCDSLSIFQRFEIWNWMRYKMNWSKIQRKSALSCVISSELYCPFSVRVISCVFRPTTTCWLTETVVRSLALYERIIRAFQKLIVSQFLHLLCPVRNATVFLCLKEFFLSRQIVQCHRDCHMNVSSSHNSAN